MGSSLAGSSDYLSDSISDSSANISKGVVEIIANLLLPYLDNSWIGTIRDKLRIESEKNPNLISQIEQKYDVSFDKFAVALGEPELFKKVFLLPKYRPDKLLKEINEELQQVKEFEDMGCALTEQEINETIKRINDRKAKLSEYKFELILTECSASDIKNVLFQSLVNNFYEFGALHSALSLDGTIIEWGRGPCGASLVCPTLDLKRFLFAFEVKAREDKGFFESIGNYIKGAVTYILDWFSGGAFGRWSVGRANDKKLDKIAKICTMYNKMKFYNPLSNNCQHFVNVILKAIDSDFVSDGEFRNIIKQLEERGKVDFYFRGHYFNSRKDLDNFVKSINFSSLSINDKKLLICYKNTFDTYYRNDKNNEKYKSTEEAKKMWKDILTKEKFND